MTAATWIRSYLEKVAAGDLDAIRPYLADDAVAHFLGESKLAGDYGVVEFMEIVHAYYEGLDASVEPLDVFAGENHAAAVIRATIPSADGDYEGLRVVLYRVSGGKIQELWIFDEDQRAIDRAIDSSPGLAEPDSR